MRYTWLTPGLSIISDGSGTEPETRVLEPETRVFEGEYGVHNGQLNPLLI